jgi:predicted oxidoreductase
MTQKLVTNQIEISVLEHSALTNGDIAFHQRIATPLMAWSPLAGGALFADDHKAVHTALQQIADAQSVDVSAVAVAWLLAHPAQILPVMGTNSIERIKALSQATDVTLSRAAWYEIYTAALGREVA